MGISGYDVFKVNKKYNLSGEDIYSLSHLYLPLIGVDSFSLYIYISQLNENTEYLATKIMDALNFPTASFLDQALMKLEALGLIKTYVKNEEYLFVLNTPLNKEAFLNNGFLKSFLETKIGNLEIKKISEKKSYARYTDLTHSFDEVFERTTLPMKTIIPTFFNSLIKDNIRIKNSNFDYVIFKLSFNGSSIIDKSILDDKTFEEEIIKISYHYGLNESEMLEVVKNTVLSTKDVRIKDILKNAKRVYEAKNIDPVVFMPKEKDPFINDKLDDNTKKFLYLAENSSCENMLHSLSGMKASASELELFEKLARNTNFSQGVINVMILYVLEIKNNQIPSYNYFEKIANTWKREKISTAKEAFDYIQKQKEDIEKNNQKVVKKTREVKVPDWYKDYEKQLKEEVVEATEEEKQKALEEVIASGIFNS